MKKAALVLLVITIFLIWHVAQTGDETIIIYSPMEQYRNDELKKQLDEKFPQWDIQIMSMATAKAAAKINVEGSHTDADIVIDMECAYLERMKDNLENVEKFSRLEYLDGIGDPEGKYLIWDRQAGAIVVNQAVLDKYHLPVPKTYEDLLDPVYRNLIAMPDPKSSGTGYFFYKNLVNVWGEEKALEYFDALAVNVKQFTESGSGPIKLLVQQEVAIGLCLTFQAVDEKNNGNDFLILEPEFGSPYSLTGASIVKGKKDRAGVKEVFEFVVNDFCVYDKEYFSPGQVLTVQENKLENYPTDFSYADMTGIESVDEQERLLELWKY